MISPRRCCAPARTPACALPRLSLPLSVARAALHCVRPSAAPVSPVLRARAQILMAYVLLSDHYTL